MKIKTTNELVGILLLVCTGCAGAPPGPNADSALATKDCDRELHGIYDLGTAGNAIVTAVFTVFTLGTNIGGYEFCKYTMTLHPAPSSSVQSGIYKSYARSFSVAIPEPLKTDPQNPTGIWQSVGGYPDMAIFPAAGAVGKVYFASGSNKLDNQDAPLSPREFESRIFTKSGSQFVDARGDNLRRLYEENITLDGDPAVFVVYEEQSNISAQPSVAKHSDGPVFFFYWVIKTQTRAARLTVVWPQSCPKCDDGPEADIRKMDSGIETFVDSFRFSDSEVLSHGE